MLFSTEPKTSLDELFDREVEVERFRSGLNERLVLVLGIRRVGKSSLVLSVLNSLVLTTYLLMLGSSTTMSRGRYLRGEYTMS